MAKPPLLPSAERPGSIPAQGLELDPVPQQSSHTVTKTHKKGPTAQRRPGTANPINAHKETPRKTHKTRGPPRGWAPRPGPRLLRSQLPACLSDYSRPQSRHASPPALNVGTFRAFLPPLRLQAGSEPHPRARAGTAPVHAILKGPQRASAAPGLDLSARHVRQQILRPCPFLTMVTLSM